ncbi:hypothetical protein BJ912DRAFT_1056853 [Pholiota molesta]|nr:hypothetical protein BJ912DRAFT_1056853 [Pholiota molesta]
MAFVVGTNAVGVRRQVSSPLIPLSVPPSSRAAVRSAPRTFPPLTSPTDGPTPYGACTIADDDTETRPSQPATAIDGHLFMIATRSCIILSATATAVDAIELATSPTCSEQRQHGSDIPRPALHNIGHPGHDSHTVHCRSAPPDTAAHTLCTATATAAHTV